MHYGLYGKLVTKAGKRAEVVEILLRDLDELKAVGCLLYIVNLADSEPDAIWVTEIWESERCHGESLKLPSVKAAIAAAMPLLTGEFQQVKLSVVGGLGAPAAQAEQRDAGA